MGPAGPASAYSAGDSALAVVDQNGQEVGVAFDPFGGLLMRRIGNDAVVFFATVAGPTASSIDFYHMTADCSDSRYLPFPSVAGFAYYALVRGGTVFYTKTMDPSGTIQMPIVASEHFEPGDDATQPGTCTPYGGGPASVGVVTMATDPVLGSLALPLRLK
jgi:hypothetical protein